jgi:hypothetical protein
MTPQRKLTKARNSAQAAPQRLLQKGKPRASANAGRLMNLLCLAFDAFAHDRELQLTAGQRKAFKAIAFYFDETGVALRGAPAEALSEWPKMIKEDAVVVAARKASPKQSPPRKAASKRNGAKRVHKNGSAGMAMSVR